MIRSILSMKFFPQEDEFDDILRKFPCKCDYIIERKAQRYCYSLRATSHAVGFHLVFRFQFLERWSTGKFWIIKKLTIYWECHKNVHLSRKIFILRCELWQLLYTKAIIGIGLAEPQEREKNFQNWSKKLSCFSISLKMYWPLCNLWKKHFFFESLSNSFEI